MKALKDADNPLFKRFTREIHLKEMDYLECSAFYPHAGIRERIMLYSVFGGVPFLNNLIDSERSVEDNIIDLFVRDGKRPYKCMKKSKVKQSENLKGNLADVHDSLIIMTHYGYYCDEEENELPYYERTEDYTEGNMERPVFQRGSRSIKQR